MVKINLLIPGRSYYEPYLKGGIEVSRKQLVGRSRKFFYFLFLDFILGFGRGENIKELLVAMHGQTPSTREEDEACKWILFFLCI